MDFDPASPGQDPISSAGINLLNLDPIPPKQTTPNPEHLNVTASLSKTLATTSDSPAVTPTALNKVSKKGKLPGSSSASDAQKPKQLKCFVFNLMEHKCDTYEGTEFAERAMMNLARKLSSNPVTLSDWENAILTKTSATNCVGLTRPKDGRMTVAKSHLSSTKKVFPQVVLCQIFRWPGIVFHNDIRSTPNCTFPNSIKPQDNEERDQICLNPYHFELTAEAQNRFRKNASKISQDSVPTVSVRKGKKSSKKSVNTKKNPEKSKVEDIVIEGGKPQDFDSQGIDYIKLWQEKSTKGDFSCDIQPFDFKEIQKEIKFLTLENGEEISDKLKEKLELESQIQRILNGEHLQGLDVNKSIRRGVKYPGADDVKGKPEDSQDKNVHSDVPVEEPEADSADISVPDDSSIQDLLDDIREGFERQFDDDFEGLTDDNLGTTADSTAPMNFGLDSNFPNFSDQQQSSQQTVPLQSSSQSANEEMPCIVGNWSEGSGSYLNADSMNLSEEEFHSLFTSQQQYPMHQEKQHYSQEGQHQYSMQQTPNQHQEQQYPMQYPIHQQQPNQVMYNFHGQQSTAPPDYSQYYQNYSQQP